jgi:hypothetical protein
VVLSVVELSVVESSVVDGWSTTVSSVPPPSLL